MGYGKQGKVDAHKIYKGERMKLLIKSYKTPVEPKIVLVFKDGIYINLKSYDNEVRNFNEQYYLDCGFKEITQYELRYEPTQEMMDAIEWAYGQIIVKYASRTEELYNEYIKDVLEHNNEKECGIKCMRNDSDYFEFGVDYKLISYFYAGMLEDVKLKVLDKYNIERQLRMEDVKVNI